MAGLVAYGWTLCCFADPPKAPPKDDLQEIISTAKRYELTVGPDKLPLQFETEPVLRWSNATRNDGPGGGTFIWTREGRPEVIACIFYGDGGGLSFGFQSLATDNLVAKEGEQIFWRPKSAGIKLQAFANAAAPADTPTKRLSQMKALARRFECRLSGEGADREHLRLLPTPIYRYKAERKDLIDGALFAFVQGTDPEVILTLEASASAAGPAKWQYALTRRSMLGLEAKLDDKPVWQVPLNGGGVDQDWFTATYAQIKAGR